MPRRTFSLRAVALGALAPLVLAGCASNAPAADAGTLTVESSADSCTVSAAEVPSGTLTFAVTNTGTETTEFYLLAEDGVEVVGEVENIGPGLTRELVVQAAPGSYWTVCKPGMTGDGLRSELTVTDAATAVGPSGGADDAPAASEAAYLDHVREGVAALVTGTGEFAAA